MPAALLILYVIIEVAAFTLVASWIGFGWALLALAGLFFLGVFVASIEVRRLSVRAFEDARAAAESGDEEQARRALANAGTMVVDSAMLMVGSILLALPGFVTTVLGLLLILPPTRWVLKAIGGATAAAWFQKMGSSGMYVVQRRGVTFTGDESGFPGGFPGMFPGGPGGASRRDPGVIDHDDFAGGSANAADAAEADDTADATGSADGGAGDGLRDDEIGSFFENLDPADFRENPADGADDGTADRSGDSGDDSAGRSGDSGDDSTGGSNGDSGDSSANGEGERR